MGRAVVICLILSASSRTRYHWRQLLQVFLSRQTRVCCDKTRLACRDKTMLVATKLFLSRQNYVCRDRSFVATNIILVAGPASGNQGLGKPSEVETNKCGIYNKRLLLAGSEPCTRPGEKRTRPFVATKPLSRQK